MVESGYTPAPQVPQVAAALSQVPSVSLDTLIATIGEHAAKVNDALQQPLSRYTKEKAPALYALETQFNETYERLDTLISLLQKAARGVTGNDLEKFRAQYRISKKMIEGSVERAGSPLEAVQGYISQGGMYETMRDVHTHASSFYAQVPEYLKQIGDVKEKIPVLPKTGWIHTFFGTEHKKTSEAASMWKYVFWGAAIVAAHTVAHWGYVFYKRSRQKEGPKALKMLTPGKKSATTQKTSRSTVTEESPKAAQQKPLLRRFFTTYPAIAIATYMSMGSFGRYIERRNQTYMNEALGLEHVFSRSYRTMTESIAATRNEIASLEKLAGNVPPEKRSAFAATVSEEKRKLLRLEGQLDKMRAALKAEALGEKAPQP